MTLNELLAAAGIIKDETGVMANTHTRVGTMLTHIINFFKDKVDSVPGKSLSTNDYDDLEKAEVAKVKDKISFTIQELNAAQQAQARLNIKAAKHDVITIADFSELDRVDLEDGYYKVISSGESPIDGFMFIGRKYEEAAYYSVMQIFMSNIAFKGRNIVIAAPQTYAPWVSLGGGGGTGDIPDLADMPDFTNLRGLWSSKAPGNHNHDTTYAGFIKLESITGAPLIPQINTYWYDNVDKEIYLCTGIVNEVPEVTALAPKSGKIYKYIYTYYAWDGAELSEIGINSQLEGVEAALDVIITALEGI